MEAHASGVSGWEEDHIDMHLHAETDASLIVQRQQPDDIDIDASEGLDGPAAAAPEGAGKAPAQAMPGSPEDPTAGGRFSFSTPFQQYALEVSSGRARRGGRAAAR